MDFKARRVHLIGIGGSGMFPLALLLCEAGARVSGTDTALSQEKHARLLEVGARIGPREPKASHDWICVVSPAIPQHDPELRWARRIGVPVLSRAEALAALLDGRPTVCVAGSHGKSTVTAMLAHIAQHVPDLDAGYMIGAAQKDRAPARLGQTGGLFVTEACEAFGALQHWTPTHVVLTGLDDEHAEHYGGRSGLDAAFQALLDRMPPDGTLVVNGHSAAATRLAEHSGRDVVACGAENGHALRVIAEGDRVDVVFQGDRLGPLTLGVLGQHNVQNALLALAMALKLGVAPEAALATLSDFQGISRRLEVVSPEGTARIVDDFAHHPAEVQAGLDAIRPSTTGRLISLFEPQLHSRTQRLAGAYAGAFSLADHVVVLPVAALGERTDGEASTRALKTAFETGGVSFELAEELDEAIERIGRSLNATDTLVVMGGPSSEGIAEEVARVAASAAQDVQAETSVLIGRQTAPADDVLWQIRRQVEHRPQAPALEIGQKTLSYRALWDRANGLAARLTAKGIAPGDVVSVYLRPNLDRVTGFLACLQIGAVFHPLDPELPDARVAHMLQDAGSKLVLVNAASPALPSGDWTYLTCDFLDDGSTSPEPILNAAPEDLAYLIYTSGSTGTPKGVEVQRGAISNFATSARRVLGITDKSRLSLVTAFGFDVNIGDMVLALSAGACLIVPTELEGRPGAGMGRYLETHGVSHLSVTPSVLRALPAGRYPKLETIIALGEVCSSDLVATWGQNRRFINAYGPTEATVLVSSEICHAGQRITIGQPFDNISACVLGPDLTPVPRGTEGELCLFGACLAKGYRNQTGATEAQFPTLLQPAFLPETDSVRLYRTGDRARITPDGKIDFLGRLDDQMKVLGHRVDPTEIEHALLSQEDIRDCAVTLWPSANGIAKLAAFLVPADHVTSLDTAKLRADLALDLPYYMRPAILQAVDHIPRSANGKKDKAALYAALPDPEPTHPKTPQSETERRAMSVLTSLMPLLPQCGIRDRLFDLGLDSLDLVRLLTALEEEFDVVFDAAIPPGSETLEILCLLIDAKRASPKQVRPSSVANTGQDLVDLLAPHLATWPGIPISEGGLFRQGADAGPPQLYWMCQAGWEFEALRKALADLNVAVAATRSGHLLYPYCEGNLIAMSQRLADEIEATHVGGPVYVGGNCQGGGVMLQVAKELRARGFDIATVFLMEQGRFPGYDGPVTLLFGDGSYLNPYTNLEKPDAIFRAAYPAGYSVNIVPGQHGQYFNPFNVKALATEIRRHMQ